MTTTLKLPDGTVVSLASWFDNERTFVLVPVDDEGRQLSFTVEPEPYTATLAKTIPTPAER